MSNVVPKKVKPPAAGKPNPRKPRKPRKKTDRRHYTDDFRVTALYALHLSGGDESGTARRLGIPGPTLRCWAHGSRVPYLLQLQEEKKNNVVSQVVQNLWLLLAGLSDPAAVFRAPISQRATAFGILFDKLAMLVADPRKVDPGKPAAAQTVPAGPGAELVLDRVADRLSPDDQYSLYKLLRKLGGDGDDLGRGEGVSQGVPGVPERSVPGDGSEPGQPVQ